MKKIYLSSLLLLAALLLPLHATAAATNKGDLSNLVCFIQFADDTEEEAFTRPFPAYDKLFNDDRPDSLSLFNYFKRASYGQLSWRTGFFPAPNSGAVVACRTKYERGYYQPYQAGINDSGYKDDVAGAARLQALVIEIANYLDKHLPADQTLDADQDGFIDNLTYVFSGNSDRSASHMLWPKRLDVLTAPGKEVYVHGKRFVGCLMVFDQANGYRSAFSGGLEPIDLNLGLVCHESSHSLGTYDLYHANDSQTPVGMWDLMSNQGLLPQQMMVYTKMKYCHWVDSIPEISVPGTYKLNPVGGPDKENIAYKIHPLGSDEYFVVEYRRREAGDISLPESGLLVYRINPRTSGGNVNYNGTTILDETYVFRPGGSLTSDGTIAKAVLSAESGRTAFGGAAPDKPFYSDGTVANFAISQVSACGETITFTLGQTEQRIVLSDSALMLAGTAGSAGSLTVASDVEWQIRNVPDWLMPSAVQGPSGTTQLVFVAAADNTDSKVRQAVITVAATHNPALQQQFTVAQVSNLVSMPNGLHAVIDSSGVSLSWNAVPVGKKILSEDFENTDNPNGWQMQNVGTRGWHWQLKNRTYKAYDGNYSAAMWSAWDSESQNETLTSPTLDHATTLVFQSCNTGMGLFPVKNPQEYNVEVSSDNGATWHVLLEVRSLGGRETSNKYMEVAVDLSAYASSQMRVRFHAFDKPLDPADPIGLAYNWMVDNIELYAADASHTLQGYRVYRNGELIGTAPTPSFVDKAPLPGTNVYTVAAVTSKGESSASQPATVNVTPTGIRTAVRTLLPAGVYMLGGIRVADSARGLAKGVYIVRGTDAAGRATARKMVVR
ncbi:choice-of-anchor J domain-containing protein [Hallella seregens]|uniref:Choice-of-anchor J domain-containing protein n=1 Tax=Hallella seregens ATCC 51272 TaxID=1336250 RepID=A0ABV5ZHK0_9BACT|nr:choice-of-anchor J domain-containing protein [Hallella seregens]